MSMLRKVGTAVLLVAAGIFSPLAQGANQTFTLHVEAGKHDRRGTPVVVRLPLPADFTAAVVMNAEGAAMPAQLAAPGLIAESKNTAKGERELIFLLPALKAGHAATFTAKLSTEPLPGRDGMGFAWQETPGEYADLTYTANASRPVLRYMHKALDASTKEARELTYKPYHHVYSPDGKQLLTKGPGGQFTHHRGLFFAFNRVTYGDNKKADVWHCTGDAFQSHEGVLFHEAGPVLGRHRVAIDWHGVAKEVFAREQRELTVYNAAGGHLIEFASRVQTTGGPVKLDGDPQHAGFHFRAAQEVAEKTKGQTYYLRTDGQGKPAETRNWNPQNKQGPVNLPWNAMSFVVGDQRYTAVYLDHPQNPKEARYSERDYGRFGSYFEYELTAEHPLVVNYRVWLQPGELTVEQAAALAADFTDPPRVSVK